LDVVESGLQLINHRCLDNNCQIVQNQLSF
jgi:hypothetical protein